MLCFHKFEKQGQFFFSFYFENMSFLQLKKIINSINFFLLSGGKIINAFKNLNTV